MSTATGRAAVKPPLLGLPAFRVELRYLTDEKALDGSRIEAIQHSWPYVEESLAKAEFRRRLDQLGLPQRDGRWHLVLIDASDGRILKEFTR